jgi:alpha-N-arabinofuranosidase
MTLFAVKERRHVAALSVFFFLLLALTAQEDVFINPIIPGGYPDPSICFADEAYYIVNSSFEYFPGLPIHKSADLVNWELIGYGLHRPEQCTGVVNLVDVQSNGGIHAPTIRHHNGLFYIITTNVYYHEETNTTDFVNFIITAENAVGPWSEPHVLEGAPGIDPDIFFDDDGKVWYVGTHSPENPTFPGEGEIWLQEIDLNNWSLKGERSYLWRGACGGVWVEGPHMYKKDGRYYLMVAEGGTSFNHAVMIAVSDDIHGPYISNERNPILSTRQLSYDNWVHSTGHADLIELPDGRWFMVALGIRGDEDRGSNMGRETHLLPVQWEREPFEWKEVRYEWPVVAPQTGRVERINPLPFQDFSQDRVQGFSDDFNTEALNLKWNFRRVPLVNTYSLSDNKGYLRLYANPEVIKERGRCSLLGLRQRESDFEYSTKMTFKARQDGDEAGISLFQKDDNYLAFMVKRVDKQYRLILTSAIPQKDPEEILSESLDDFKGDIIFKVESKDHKYHFFYSTDDGGSFESFAETAADLILSKGYTGAYLGLYVTSNGNKPKSYADFDWVRYEDFQRLTTE